VPDTDTVPAPRHGRLVLVGGPPGAGKTAVAGVVASAAQRPAVHLHTDSFYAWIKAGFVPPYLPRARGQNEVVTTVMTAAACAYARGGYDVIAEGILGPWLLPPFRRACQREDVPLSYVVLRPSLDVTLARAVGRAGGQLTDPEPVTGLYRAFTGLGTLESHVIDSSTQTIEETAADLASGVHAAALPCRHRQADSRTDISPGTNHPLDHPVNRADHPDSSAPRHLTVLSDAEHLSPETQPTGLPVVRWNRESAGDGLGGPRSRQGICTGGSAEMKHKRPASTDYR
jgi:predicted kinase